MDHSSHAHHHRSADSAAPVLDHEGHSMAFHFGSMETILFKFWMPENTLGMFVSCVIVIAMCFLMETIRWLRSYRAAQAGLNNPLSPEERLRYAPSLTGAKLMDSVLHLLQLTLSYSLMLVFMTFNVSLCIAVLVGEVLSRLVYSVLFPHLDTAMAGSGCG